VGARTNYKDPVLISVWILSDSSKFRANSVSFFLFFFFLIYICTNVDTTSRRAEVGRLRSWDSVYRSLLTFC